LTTNCDPWGREIGLLKVYVPIFKFLNFNDSFTYLIGNSLQVLFILSVYSLAYALRIDLRNFKTSALIALCLVSPPIALLIERGQLETIVFVFIVFSAILIFAKRKFMAYFALGFVSILKLYPIILFGFILASRRIKKSRVQLAVGLFVFGASLALILNTLRHEGRSLWTGTLTQSAGRTFGVTAPTYRAIDAFNSFQILSHKLLLHPTRVQLAGLIFFLMVLVGIEVFRSRGKVFKPDLSNLVKKKDLVSYVLLFTLCMVCLSYFLVTSFDYRMVYLVPLLLIGLKQVDKGNKGKIREMGEVGNYLIYGTLIALWSQVTDGTSALAQFPILLSLAIVLSNITPAVLKSFFKSKNIKN
jgi:hypothetical protein